MRAAFGLFKNAVINDLKMVGLNCEELAVLSFTEIGRNNIFA